MMRGANKGTVWNPKTCVSIILQNRVRMVPGSGLTAPRDHSSFAIISSSDANDEPHGEEARSVIMACILGGIDSSILNMRRMTMVNGGNVEWVAAECSPGLIKGVRGIHIHWSTPNVHTVTVRRDHIASSSCLWRELSIRSSQKHTPEIGNSDTSAFCAQLMRLTVTFDPTVWKSYCTRTFRIQNIKPSNDRADWSFHNVFPLCQR